MRVCLKPWLSRVFLATSICLLWACKEQLPTEKIIAQVADSKLYATELQGLLEPATSHEDSSEVVSQYVDSWVRSRAFIEQAKQYLDLTQIASVEGQVEQYRESLLSYQFENAIMAAELDTVITAIEIEEYYKTHIEEFELAEPIIKGIYIKTDSLINKKDSVILWLNEFVETNNDAQLRSYCSYYAIDCNLNAEEWKTESNWLETLDISIGTDLYKNRNSIKVFDNGKYKYLYLPIEIQSSGRAPIEFVRTNIEQRILRTRKNEFVKALKNRIYEKAVDRGEIEIYE